MVVPSFDFHVVKASMSCLVLIMLINKVQDIIHSSHAVFDILG